MEIVNPGNEDFHMHTINFSDGMHTVDELVVMAGKIGMTKIAITDHSQACWERFDFMGTNSRGVLRYRQNIHNDVEVVFGIEGDLLNSKGDCCFDLRGKEGDFLILSCHNDIYNEPFETIMSGYENAIRRYHDKIDVLGHPCISYNSPFVDIERLVEIANEYDIPMEFNAKNLVYGNTDIKKLHKMLKTAKYVYVNSDAHTLYDFTTARKKGFEFLKENCYI